jgi:predicted aspartyl protease
LIGLGTLGFPAGMVRAGQGTANPSLFQKSPIALPKNAPLPVVLPFTFWNGLLLIDGVINSSTTPDRFVLNSGMNANAVTDELYTRHKLQASARQVRVAVLDRVTEGTEVQIQKLQIGTVILENVETTLVDVYRLLSSRTRADAPAAWLGTPFLFAFQVTLDFDSRVVVLNAPKTPLPSDTGTVVLPFTLKEGRIFVRVNAPGGGTFLAMVDTGAVGTLIPTSLAEKLKCQPQASVIVKRPNGVEGRVLRTVLPKLQIGKLEVPEVPALFVAPDAPKDFDRTVGVLGVDFLRHFKITLSYAQKKIAFTSPAPAEPSLPRSGS